MITPLYLLFGVLCGVVEAILYSRRGAESFTWNEHIVLVLQRGSVALVALTGAHDGRYDWVAAQLLVIAAGFSFFHNNAYNFTRRWLDLQSFAQAAKGFDWNYQSPTSTARFDFSGPQRNVLAFISLLLWLAGWKWLL